jgi:hypothetical protein
LQEVWGVWRPALPPGVWGAERLEASLTGWIDYVARRPTVARMLLRESASFQPGQVSPFVHAASTAIEWFRAVIDEGVASGELEPRIGPYRFMSLMGAITLFHVAAMPWLSLTVPADAELDEHKREILFVARSMLGIPQQESPAGGIA